MFQRGQILEITIIDNVTFAKVLVAGGSIEDKVLIILPYNTSAKVKLEERSIDTNQILLFKSFDDSYYGIPYNAPLQTLLDAGEYEIGNLTQGNKITFKANGDIIILSSSGTNITIKENGDVELADATSPILNMLASMQVVIPGGSSAGTFPVAILTSGQLADKVTA